MWRSAEPTHPQAAIAKGSQLPRMPYLRQTWQSVSGSQRSGCCSRTAEGPLLPLHPPAGVWRSEGPPPGWRTSPPAPLQAHRHCALLHRISSQCLIPALRMLFSDCRRASVLLPGIPQLVHGAVQGLFRAGAPLNQRRCKLAVTLLSCTK